MNSASEEYFGMNPDNPYTNNIGIDDGQEITEAIIEHISDLPVVDYGGTPQTDQVYLEYIRAVYGDETCNICGKDVYMGAVHIVNPMQETSIDIPIISLHYMAHGRFAYGGTAHTGEVDPIELCTVLNINLTEIAEKYGYQLINYPNPFNVSTMISFPTTDLHRLATIKIYNIKGQIVKTLTPMINQGPMTTVQWDGADEGGKPVPSGIYLCKLEVDGKIAATRKGLLMR